ncbi:hypothetical protein ABZS61_23395 [Streptomyces sp. NPDC005566]|uniref:hypothetical protein n=1 Tax=Streptomyces sp. NPDC005566 TaxID=3156886 RepID=UPI0033AE4F7E
MRTRATAVVSVVLLLALTGCENNDDAAKPKTEPTTAAPTPEYDAADCRELLKRNYAADADRDASADPECAHLPDEQYGDLVESVLGGPTEDSRKQAENKIVWDGAWEQTTVDQREAVCDRVANEGAEAASQDMADTSEWKAADVLQYFLDEKC